MMSNKALQQPSWQLDFQLTMVLVPADRGQPAAQMCPRCWPQMEQLLLLTPHCPPPLSNEPLTVGRQHILRQISLFNLSNCADSHRLTCSSLTSWLEICVLCIFSPTPGDHTPKTFHVIAWPHTLNLMLSMLSEVRKVLAQHTVYFLLDLRWCILNVGFGLHCMKTPGSRRLLALRTKYDQWGRCEKWFCDFVNTVPNVLVTVWELLLI